MTPIEQIKEALGHKFAGADSGRCGTVINLSVTLDDTSIGDELLPVMLAHHLSEAANKLRQVYWTELGRELGTKYPAVSYTEHG